MYSAQIKLIPLKRVSYSWLQNLPARTHMIYYIKNIWHINLQGLYWSNNFITHGIFLSSDQYIFAVGGNIVSPWPLPTIHREIMFQIILSLIWTINNICLYVNIKVRFCLRLNIEWLERPQFTKPSFIHSAIFLLIFLVDFELATADQESSSPYHEE